MKGNRNYRQGVNMTNEDRQLIVETLGEMRELKGEMREFKEHVIGRVEKLERKEGERSKERISIAAVLISSAALAVSIIANFLKGWKQ
jgi:L-lactate utilization protein LutB